MTASLEWLTEQVAYIPAPVNTGILVAGKEALIVDSGLDRDHANRILRILADAALTPVGVLNTHSHADHCGGNLQLQKKLQLPVAAPALEKPFVENPYLESFALFGGANPPDALQNKFLKAPPSQVRYDWHPDDGEFQYRDFQVTLVPLPGHSPQQTGLAFDGVLFAADAILGKTYLDKHKIPFNGDVQQHRNSLERLEKTTYHYYVPGHGRALPHISEAVKRNREALDAIDEWLLAHTRTPMELETLLSVFCREEQVDMETIRQYFLYRTAFAAHLSALAARNLVRHRVADGRLQWQQQTDNLSR